MGNESRFFEHLDDALSMLRKAKANAVSEEDQEKVRGIIINLESLAQEVSRRLYPEDYEGMEQKPKPTFTQLEEWKDRWNNGDVKFVPDLIDELEKYKERFGEYK